MGCFHAKLCSRGHVDNHQEKSALHQPKHVVLPADGVGLRPLPQVLPTEHLLQGVKLYGAATAGDTPASALLCSRLVVARGHVLAAVFEGHVSPVAAEYCQHHCWEAFVQATTSWQQVPAAAALRSLDRGFLTSSQTPLESRLASGCSATLLHIDIATRTATVATVGAHGSVGLGSVEPGSAGPTAPQKKQGSRKRRGGAPEADRERCGGSQQRRSGSSGQQSGVGRSLLSVNERSCHQIRRVLTLEAPSAEGRRDLSGLVELVQSALAPTDSTAGAAGTTVPGPLPSSGATSVAGGGGAGLTSGGSGHGGTVLSRRAGLNSPGSVAPQALGFGCAKDAAFFASFDNAGGAAVPATPPAPVPNAGARFAALSRLHCGCDVRVSSRQLAAGDECLVLLAGSGTASRGAGGGRMPARASNGSCGGGGESMSGNGARSCIGSSSSGQVAASSLSLPSVCGPAGALSAADAVTLAHELAAQGAGAEAMSAVRRKHPSRRSLSNGTLRSGSTGTDQSGPQALKPAAKLEILYDSLESERGDRFGEGSAGGGSLVGDRSAQAVASYALATAALRTRALDAAARLSGAPSPAPALSASCVALWLDWCHPATLVAAPPSEGGGSGAKVLPSPARISPTARRWEILRAYCRFRAARRRRVLAAWHMLAAQMQSLPSGTCQATPPPAPPLRPLQQPQATPTWMPAQIATALRIACGSAYAAQGSAESCPGMAQQSTRTASFTSRPPVMMEFVEELPTPTGSPAARVPGQRPSALAAASDVGMGASSSVVAAAVVGAVAAASFASGTTPSATNAAAKLDESHSASAATPYGISGMVVAPMGSTEDAEDASSAAEQMAASQRRFIVAGGATSHISRIREGLMVRNSHSSPDLAAVERQQQGQGQSASQDGAGSCSHRSTELGDTSDDSDERVVDIAAQEEAVAFARSSAGFSSSQGATGASPTSPGSGATMDWSLVMTSVNQNSVPRNSNSAGNTPIPSAATNRLSPMAQFADSAHSGGSPGLQAQLAAGVGTIGDGPVPASGGYLPIPSGSGYRKRRSSPQQAQNALSPLASGLGVLYFPRCVPSTKASSSSSSKSASWGDVGGTAFSADSLPPGVLVGPRAAGDDLDGDVETEVELVSEDLPQLRIESTAELAALMAEIIITDDGEVVRGAGGTTAGGGGQPPPPYMSRSHHGHHKGGRPVSRQGSRGWQPRLAIVREDAREANTSNSCSQVLLGDGMQFAPISEERGSHNSTTTTGEIGQGSGSERSSTNNSQHSQVATTTTTSGSSPGGSVEEPAGAAAAMAVGPPPFGLPRAVGPPTAMLAIAAAAGVSQGPGVAASRLLRPSREAEEALPGSPSIPALSPFVTMQVVQQQEHGLQDAAAAVTAAATYSTKDAAGYSSFAGVSSRGRAVAEAATHEDLSHATAFAAVAAAALMPYGFAALRALPRGAAAVSSDAAEPREQPAAGEAVVQEPAPPLPPLESGVSTSTGAAAEAAAALADVLNDLRPSLDRERIAGDPGSLLRAGGSCGGSGVIIGSAHASPARLGHAEQPPFAPGSNSMTQPSTIAPGSVIPGLGACGIGRHRSRSSTQLPRLLSAAAATGDVDCGSGDNVGEARGSDTVGWHGGRGRPTLAMVGRSQSAMSARQQHHHQQQQQQQQLSNHDGHHHQHRHHHGNAAAGASNHDRYSAQRHQRHHHATSHHTRQLYGLTDPSPQLPAGATAKSSSSIPPPPPPPSAGEGLSANALDRAWSVGSTSGPLYSLLHSTLSKSSMTGLTSTAIPTPGCTSAQGSGNRLTTLMPGSLLSPTASMAAAGGGDHGDGASPACSSILIPAPTLCVLPRSLSSLRHESGGLGSAGTMGVPPAPPSLVATDCSSPTLRDESATLSVTLQPPLAVGQWPLSNGGEGAADLAGHPMAERSRPLAAAASEGGTVAFCVDQQPATAPPSALPSDAAAHAAWPPLPPAAVTAAAADAPPNSTVTFTAYGTDGTANNGYGGCLVSGSAAAAGSPDAMTSYDDGGPNNRSSNISRSDASVWNSTSAWTASTGRTTDMLMGGSGRRVGGGGFMTMSTGLNAGLGLGGGIGGGGDTSGLIRYNAVYGSVSGLLVTADAGAPGSNTQLLMQMAPSASNTQHSTNLYSSSRQAGMFPPVVLAAGAMVGGAGGDGCLAPEGATAAAGQMPGHPEHRDMQLGRRLQPALAEHNGASSDARTPSQRAQSQPHAAVHRQDAQPGPNLQQDLYRPTAAGYDRSGQGLLIHQSVLDSASSCLMYGSTSTNAAYLGAMMMANASRTSGPAVAVSSSSNARTPQASVGEHNALLRMEVDDPPSE